jgi:hypothetical protein
VKNIVFLLSCLLLLVALLPSTADAQGVCPRCGSVPAAAWASQPTPADSAVAPTPATADPRVEHSVLVRRTGAFWRRGPVRRIVSWPWRVRGLRCG